MVLPNPCALMASPLLVVPSCCTVPPASIFNVELLLNSMTLGPLPK
ncbi:hypothetical protein [uncultured Fusobacterium sp.]|nr:hypothetical protein [uncultured Fusobacterium sp.]